MKKQLIKKSPTNITKIKPSLTEKTISFKIDSVKDIEFYVTSLNRLNINHDFKNFEFKINWFAESYLSEKKIKLSLVISFFYKNHPKSKLAIISYTNETLFSIANFDEIINATSSKDVGIHPEFLMNFIAISISTVRGILISKLSNTEYHSIILPLIDKKMLHEIFEKSKLKH